MRESTLVCQMPPVVRRLVYGFLPATVLALAVLYQTALAQTYPSRPIRLLSASAAGSGSDVIARLLSPRLAEHFGQSSWTTAPVRAA